jgi:glycerophosphoryl diester phosphodiesterase
MNTIQIPKGNTRMVAHAGLHGLEAGNTNAGFIAAGNRSYWGIECDIRMAKDGPVVIHNNTTEGVSPTVITVSESTVEELQQILLYERNMFYGMEKFGLSPVPRGVRSDLRIPSLEEYIRICKHYGKICVAELKHAMTPEAIACVAETYRRLDYADSVVFISFHWENLTEIRKHFPNCAVQFLTDEKRVFSDGFLDEVAAEGFDLDIHIFTVTRELVERIHARGIRVNVWTCDWPDQAANLVAWGVDYITSNILE